MKTTPFILCCATLIFCRSLLAGDSDTAAKPGDACCQPKPAATEPAKSCCAASPESVANQKSEIVTLSRDSLYQADATFTDDSGKPFVLSSLRGRPVALNMFFSSCGYACPLTVTDMLAIQGRLPAELRSKTLFVLVSFDVSRDTTEALAKYRTQRGLDSQWIILRGTDDSVRELAALLGVKFKQEADGAFAHSNLVTILNPEGEIIHQRTGLQGGLNEATAALIATGK